MARKAEVGKLCGSCCKWRKFYSEKHPAHTQPQLKAATAATTRPLASGVSGAELQAINPGAVGVCLGGGLGVRGRGAA